MAIQCDCFCGDKSIYKFYPESCDQCTIELCKKNNTKGFSGWCLFGKRAAHCSAYHDLVQAYAS